MADPIDEAAAFVVEQMSDDERADFDRDEWAEPVSLMLADDWADLDVEDVLDAVEAMLRG